MSVSIERCHKLIRDLRTSPDDRTDREILRAFADELTELEAREKPTGGKEWVRKDGKPLDIRFVGVSEMLAMGAPLEDQIPGQITIDEMLEGS